MKLNILRRTSDFRGDHSADIAIAYEYIPHETIEDLIRRVQLLARWPAGERPGDVLEIRIIGVVDEQP